MLFSRKSEKIEAETSQSDESDLTELKKAVRKANLPKYVSEVVAKEMERLEKSDPSIPEYTIGYTYIEFLISLPWQRFSDDNMDVGRAEEILDSRHYGLQPVKERIVEYLAVRTLCSHLSFRILVVDDEAIARANLEHVLKKEGYQVSTAANGLEALNTVKEHPFDLILTDLKMEKMDGSQLLESAKKISPDTEVIMITGFATVDSAVDALKKGATHYLPKPVNLDELRTIVKQTLEKKKHLSMTRSPVLCFAGPPGTGKTSVGRAVAEALGRKFIRVSLAGLRDEAELRGHRRTYVGAMCGRIISEIQKTGVKNPVFMLDEIDKIGQDFRGDPASVLLEILDPEQNSRFSDHYLDMPFDLSGVMFIATANVTERLPGPLLDRLELIHFTGYTENEKHEISKRYLIPRQLKEHGLSQINVEFSESGIARIIQDYTREAGLRNLERVVATVCRKLARICVNSRDNSSGLKVDDLLVENLLGPRRYTHEIAESTNQIGVVTGLVWTEFGGEIIFVESTIMRGTRQLILTGSLGEVLRESAQTALSFIRSRAEQLGIDPDFLRDRDIHIHLPSGAIPKDGPSAGVTIALSLISLLTGRAARREVAMTGELTLNGKILPVSGIREKLLAAQRAGIERVIFPQRNAVDVNRLEPELRNGAEITLAEDAVSLIDVVLV